MRDRRILIAVGLVAVLVLVGLWLQPRIEQTFAPVPKAAWVGIEINGEGRAVIGPVEVTAGTPFALHAVLEAETRSGERVFYTRAGSVVFEGEAVDPAQVRPWDQLDRAQVLWFTVEGIAPFVELAAEESLEELRFQELFHPEWSTQWRVVGVLDPRFDDQIGEENDSRKTFGTQHYQVWIELFDSDNPLVPEHRFKSWGADEMLSRAGLFSAIRAALPEAPVASAVFGLSQIELPSDAGAEQLEAAARLSSHGVVFSRLFLLRDILRRAGVEPGEQAAQRVDLAEGPAWQDEVSVGDLIQVGSRWVVLYRDDGRAGVLDPDDLCFDFEQGAAIRRLRDVFSGEGEVDWVPL